MTPSVQATTVFLGFFAIMNPIANVPVFLGLTEGRDHRDTIAIARRALLLAFGVVAVFSLAGQVIFSSFGITLPAFRIAGGLLVGLIGFHMVQGNHSRVTHPEQPSEAPSAAGPSDVAVSPLAMPILAGPGTIATAMSFSASGTVHDLTITLVMFAAMCGLTYVMFASGERMVRLIGPRAMSIVTRMMGLLIAVIGVQMILDGVAASLGHAA